METNKKAAEIEIEDIPAAGEEATQTLSAEDLKRVRGGSGTAAIIVQTGATQTSIKLYKQISAQKV